MKYVISLIVLVMGFAIAIPLSSYGFLYGIASILVAGLVVLTLMK